jgi:hypothetical protein
MASTLQIPAFSLEEGENVIQESPSVCSMEFDKQKDYIETIVGRKSNGRIVCKPYLTNKRIILWMCVVPEEGDPKMFWNTLPVENITYMRMGKGGKEEKGKKGIEIEFTTAKIGGVSTIFAKKLNAGGKIIDEKVNVVGGVMGGMVGWLGDRMKEEKMKVWLYIPDMMEWNVGITRLLQSLPKATS